MVYLDSFPEPRPATVFARGSHTTVGSSGAGKAMNLRSLGAETTLWGAIGQDEAGRKIVQFLDEWGIRFIPTNDPAGTMRHINLMDAAGDRISIFATAGSPDIDIDLEPLIPVIEAADVVTVTIMSYCRRFLPLLRGLGKDIWIDIHDYDGRNTYHREFIEAADYLFMSSQAHVEWRSFLEERIATGATAAVATHGADGASGITPGDGWIDIPAMPPVEIVDTNGAGDAFFAGFAVAWSAGTGLRGSLEAGAEHAALAIASPDLAPQPA